MTMTFQRLILSYSSVVNSRKHGLSNDSLIIEYLVSLNCYRIALIKFTCQVKVTSIIWVFDDFITVRNLVHTIAKLKLV